MFSPHGCVMGPGHPDAARFAAMAKSSVPMNKAARKTFQPRNAAHAQAAIDAARDNLMGEKKIDQKFIERMEQYIRDNPSYANTPPPATPAQSRDDLRALMADLMGE